jgi:L-threonylcarbamoyladenylate synthase
MAEKVSTQVLKAAPRPVNEDAAKIANAAVKHGAAILRKGGLVAFPSETVYGLGADATNPTAVARIFEVKQRPQFNPLIVHLADASWLERCVESVPEEANRLAERFWPGPLTLVLPKRAVIPDIVTAGLPTVAVRVPSHPIAHALIVEADLPMAAPSANRFGHISPTTAQAVAEDLSGSIELILDGGHTEHGLESSVVAFGASGPRLLRPGPITREELSKCLGRDVALASMAAGAPESPGQLQRHYAPHTPLKLVTSSTAFVPLHGKKAGLLAFRRTLSSKSFETIEVLSMSGDLCEAAANLFSAMRRLDEAGLDLIVAESIPETGLGLAIMDRLRKAAAPRV